MNGWICKLFQLCISMKWRFGGTVVLWHAYCIPKCPAKQRPVFPSTTIGVFLTAVRPFIARRIHQAHHICNLFATDAHCSPKAPNFFLLQWTLQIRNLFTLVQMNCIYQLTFQYTTRFFEFLEVLITFSPNIVINDCSNFLRRRNNTIHHFHLIASAKMNLNRIPNRKVIFNVAVVWPSSDNCSRNIESHKAQQSMHCWWRHQHVRRWQKLLSV